MIAARALLLGWSDLLRPQSLGLVLGGVVLTLALFLGLQAALFFALRLLGPDHITLPLLGSIEIGHALSWGSLALFPVLSIFLMTPVAAGFAGLFSDRIAAGVEARHYHIVASQPPDWFDSLLEGVAVMAAALAIAVAVLLATPMVGPLAPLLFYGANGWLLGREFLQMAARRHLAEADATAFRRAHMARASWLGTGIAVLLSVPLLNIAVPVLAAAAFTHLFQLSRAAVDPSFRHPRG